MIFTGENWSVMAPRPTTIQSYADRIQDHWHRATKSIMEVALLCAEANNQLIPADKKKLLKLLPFTLPTFSKLAQIGNDPRLHSQKVQKLLPPSYSIMYSIHQLQDTELSAAIKEGVINPTLRRGDLVDWLEAKKFRPYTSSSPAINLPQIFFAAIRLPDKTTAEAIKRLNAILDKVRLEFNAEIVRPRDQYAERMGRWDNRVMNCMRISGRRIVAETKRRALKKGKKWAIHWDEVDIPNDAAPDRIQEVLDLIGRGDEFQKLHADAYSIPQPKPPKSPAPTAAEQQRDLDLLAEQIKKKRRHQKPTLKRFTEGT